MMNGQGLYSAGRLRDQFLNALDDRDAVLGRQLAQQLVSCDNLLPGMACDQLGLPRNSTYSSAARVVLDASSIPAPVTDSASL